MPSYNQIENLLTGELNSSSPYKDQLQTTFAGINNLTRKRVQDLLSRYSTTGLGRSGIGGAALNDVYSTAGQNLSGAASDATINESNRRNQILSQLLGLSQLQEQKKQSETSFLDVLGGIGGGVLGSFLGPVGAAGGSALGGLLFGGGKASGGG